MGKYKYFYKCLVCIFILFLALFHIYQSYSSLTQTKDGYLYCIDSDDFFRFSFSVSLHNYDSWQTFLHLVPFYTFNYDNPVGGEYLGKLNELNLNIIKNRHLRRKHPEKYAEKIRDELDEYIKYLDNLKEGKIYMETYDIQYYTIKSINTIDEVPEAVKVILNNSYDNVTGMYLVDAVVIKSTIKVGERKKLKDIKELNGAILFRGKAAYMIRQQKVAP